MTFFAELKRRNVLRVAGLYASGAWLVAQVSSTALPTFDAPPWVARAVLIALAIGFVPALVFSWVFELTPEGLKREREVDRSGSITPVTGKRIDRVILVVLTLALGYFAFDKFALAPRRVAAMQEQNEAKVAEARKQGGMEALIKSYGDKSIAVLPFVNMSSDKEQEYFSDGITEELLNQLAKIPELRVIARTSSFAYKGKEIKIDQVAKELSVAHILEGSIRKAGNTIRITAQLIRTIDSSHLWSGTYDRELDDIFKVQDEIAGAVVGQLKLSLLRSGAPKRQLDPRAYAMFLQARQLGRLGTKEGYDEAERLLLEVTRIDPDHPVAWDQLAFIQTARAYNGLLPTKAAHEQARAYVAKALAADPAFAVAYASLSWMESDEGNLSEAARQAARALALDPRNDTVLAVSADILAYLNRIEESMALSERVVLIDPANPIPIANLSETYLSAGRYEDALKAARTVLALSPGRRSGQRSLTTALVFLGRGDEALAEAAKVDREPTRLELEAMAYHVLRNKAESEARRERLVALHGKAADDEERATAAFYVAAVHAFRAENDAAFEWLEKWRGAGGSGPGIASDAALAKLHDDSRWIPFLRTFGQAPEQLAKIEFKVTLPGTVGATGDAAVPATNAN